MKKIVENLANLIKVKTLVTIVVMIVFGILALRGDIQPNQVVLIVTNVIAFYFGTQHEKKVGSTEQ